MCKLSLYSCTVKQHQFVAKNIVKIKQFVFNQLYLFHLLIIT